MARRQLVLWDEKGAGSCKKHVARSGMRMQTRPSLVSFLFLLLAVLLLTGGGLFIPERVVQGVIGFCNRKRRDVYDFKCTTQS